MSVWVPGTHIPGLTDSLTGWIYNSTVEPKRGYGIKHIRLNIKQNRLILYVTCVFVHCAGAVKNEKKQFLSR